MTRKGVKLIQQARATLVDLGFDNARSNERSALTLLSLLGMKPGSHWRNAARDLHGVTPLINWMADHFGKQYAANTRETVRRQTLHQFIDAGLVVLNPDDPRRAINSKDNCYQVDAVAFDLLRKVGTAEWEPLLRAYLEKKPGLQAAYAAAREQVQIPVALPGGGEIRLTPGGQNQLLAQVLEEFCPRWTPGGQVLYVGDAGKKDPIYEERTLAHLGVKLDMHGKLPDLIVHLPDRNWLVLMEAVSSHGPVDAKRHSELKTLFGSSSAGPVYVSCFPDRATMRRFLADIAWETEAWCADAPTHLIHFNGERFLGPYDAK